MIIPIDPVISSHPFGAADQVRVRSIADDLKTRATFFWQLGKLDSEGEFVGDESGTGNVILEGADYAGWSGANDEIPALLLPLIGLLPR